MTNIVLKNFHQQLEDLVYYVHFTDKLRTTTLEENTIGYNSSIKKYETNSFVVTLYGLFEKFNEDLAELFIIELRHFYDNFTNYPPSLKRHYKGLLLKHFAEERKMRHLEYSAEEALKFLSNAFVHNDGKIDSSIFKYHQRNFSKTELDNFWKPLLDLNISNMISNEEELETFVKEINYFDNNKVFSILEKIVSDRNAIAHSGHLSEVYTTENMKNILTYFKMLSELLVKCIDLSKETSLLKIKNTNNKFKFLKCNGISFGGQVVRISLSDKDSLSLGDTIYIFKNPVNKKLISESINSKSWIKANVTDIQIERIANQGLSSIQPDLPIGIKLEYQDCKRHYIYAIEK